MPTKKSPVAGEVRQALKKTLTGIEGLDEILGGGLPAGRPTLVCGNAGCGKTLLGMEFVIHGIAKYGEPGVVMAFEETAAELATNVASLGYDIDALVAGGKLVIDHVHIERSEIEETGEYDLDGLFIRLGHAIDTVGAKRVVLDTVEALFSGLPNPLILRAELRRLFRWLKGRGVTAIITGERGEATLTRQGLEEYVSDCVILLDNRVVEDLATRRLRVVKYRGSAHGTNEYPFLINENGITVLPITSVGLGYAVSGERVSTGVERLDAMLGGEGYYRGSSILVSGTAGTGKTSLAGYFIDAACGRGERALYFAFEESPSQIMRNMRSIGLDLKQWVDAGLLAFHATRPTSFGLETHLATMYREVRAFDPKVVVVDPVSNFALSRDGSMDTKPMLMRLIDFLKGRGITSLYTSLTRGNLLENTDVEVSSLADTWLLLRDIESGGERNRGIYVLKSRGMAHSNQIREFLLTNEGAKLLDVYVGPHGVLTGSSRMTQEAQENMEQTLRRQEREQRLADIERRRRALDAQIAALTAQFEADVLEHTQYLSQQEMLDAGRGRERAAMARSRRADADSASQSSSDDGGDQ